MYNRTLVADNVVTISSRSTAVHRPLGCTKVNWAVKDMCGCSSLIAVSEKAMYFTHYFKNLAFSSTKSGAKFTPSDFQGEDLDPLEKGTTSQQTLRTYSKLFFGQLGLAAFIMTPTKERSSTTLKYADEIRLLQTKVNCIIGITPNVVSFVPEDCDYSTVCTWNPCSRHSSFPV